MKKINLSILIPLFISLPVFAKSCPENIGKYGDGYQYQDLLCKFMVSADKKSSDISRNITVTDEGMIQVFSNFPGTTNSNSTGARVYYLFPIRTKKTIEPGATGLDMKLPSGAVINFDKKGKMSSKDLKMSVSSEINSKNQSGVEIESYSNGLVFDLGYRAGNTPVLNKNAQVTVTDKHNVKCSMLNSDINKINKYEAELIYKSNLALHQFLSKKCPKLDLSDLLAPLSEDLNSLKSGKIVRVVGEQSNTAIDDKNRAAQLKKNEDALDDLVKKLDSNSNK